MPDTDAEQVLRASIHLAESFRSICRAHGFREEERVPVISRHDPSVRYTNSTISALKPYLSEAVSERVFLIQPALRLRNFAHMKRTASMSPFGCAFMAFGLVAPVSDLEEVTAMAYELFDQLHIAREDVEFRTFHSDTDLIASAVLTGVEPRVSREDPSPFVHAFGMEGVAGRNANLHVTSGGASRAVANVIVIEREGVPIGLELACGITMYVTQLHDISHPVWAGPAAGVRPWGVDVMSADALHSSVVLAIEDLPARSRGRGGNYRDFLRIIGANWGPQEDQLAMAASEIVTAELALRAAASPLREGNSELGHDEVVAKIIADYARVELSPADDDPPRAR
ncbi:hypothetical protein KZC51_12875 [Microbacterium sp. SSW1-49]|uniref:Uncharacterized protein n=1 Tax=Microbacterium croceum TaxID=2851645 RepID=A0ABT0FG28_9MICO|nr:hypothetical protein [Microbacterium croceum]MCK2037025.1 hypothetical protein [Microbacterium croceum]